MVEVNSCLLLLMRKKGDKVAAKFWAHRIFLGKVDQVETELELAGSQATNKASSCGSDAPITRRFSKAFTIEPHAAESSQNRNPHYYKNICL